MFFGDLPGGSLLLRPFFGDLSGGSHFLLTFFWDLSGGSLFILTFFGNTARANHTGQPHGTTHEAAPVRKS